MSGTPVPKIVPRLREMDTSEEGLMDTPSLTHGTTNMSTSNTNGDKVVVSREHKRKKRGVLPPESVMILSEWLFENGYNTHPSTAEKRMLSEHSALSFRQVSKWFINARRRVLPKVLQRYAESLMFQQNGTAPSFRAKLRHRHPPKNQGLPQNPVLMAQESEGHLLGLELAPDQKVIPKAQREDEAEISTSRTLLMSSPKPAWTEKSADFSNFQILVDVAVQRAVELELQKNQDTNP